MDARVIRNSPATPLTRLAVSFPLLFGRAARSAGRQLECPILARHRQPQHRRRCKIGSAWGTAHHISRKRSGPRDSNLSRLTANI